MIFFQFLWMVRIKNVKCLFIDDFEHGSFWTGTGRPLEMARRPNSSRPRVLVFVTPDILAD